VTGSSDRQPNVSPGRPTSGRSRSAAGLFDTRLCPVPGCGNECPCRDHPHAKPSSRCDQHLYAALALISVGRLDASSPKVAEALGRHPEFCLHDPRRVGELIVQTAQPHDILYRRLAAQALEYTEAELWMRELRTALAGEIPKPRRHDRTSRRRAELIARCRALPIELAREALLDTSRRPDLVVEHERAHSLTESQADDDWRRARTRILEGRLVDLVGPRAPEHLSSAA
jgi:hypothetical protein